MVTERNDFQTNPLGTLLKNHVANLQDKADQWDATQPLIRALTDEHRALHGYLIGLLRDQNHRAPTIAEYQELVGTHDAVAILIQETEDNG
jgi:hypothetical protein